MGRNRLCGYRRNLLRLSAQHYGTKSSAPDHCGHVQLRATHSIVHGVGTARDRGFRLEPSAGHSAGLYRGLYGQPLEGERGVTAIA